VRPCRCRRTEQEKLPAALLERFYEVEEGAILIDGIDIEKGISFNSGHNRTGDARYLSLPEILKKIFGWRTKDQHKQ